MVGSAPEIMRPDLEVARHSDGALTARERFMALFVAHPDYEEPAQRLLDLVDQGVPMANQYVPLLVNLHEASDKFSQVFPIGTVAGVEAGTKQLISSSLYAVNEHVDHANTTQAAIQLRSGKTLPLRLAGAQPAEILASMLSSMNRVSEVYESPTTRTMLSINNPGYRIYRFLDQERPGKAGVHVYVRPRGDYKYDDEYEYGRQNYGVDASLSIVIDNRLGEALSRRPFISEISKQHKGSRPDGRVSFRLDREGVSPEFRESRAAQKDPTIERGTIAFDSGSVLGEGTHGRLAIGTQIGRFLGWGNMLKAQAQGGTPALNHSIEGFDELLGTSQAFAAQAAHMEQMLQQRLVKPNSVRQLLKLSGIES
jgi:hypothetical protein